MERLVLNRLREELKSLSANEREEFAAEIFGGLFEFKGSEELPITTTALSAKNFDRNITATEITQFLIKLGIPTHVRGYRFIADAIELCLTNSNADLQWVKCVYVDVAKKNSTTPMRCERAIRHAIEIACNRIGENPLLRELFPFELDLEGRKPCNSRFISGVGEYLKSQYTV